MTPQTQAEDARPAERRSSIIYIVGFMGTGKSSVGLRLAENLGWTFCDLDTEIERAAGQTVSEIFRNRGEADFRRLESDELRRVSARSSAVVALGGGAFCSEENRRVTAATGTSVWLDAPLEVIMARCAGDSSRPLFGDRRAMAALLESRRPAYELADLRVEVEGLTAEEIATRILALLSAGAIQRPDRPGFVL
jgi:shikimate kinase